MRAGQSFTETSVYKVRGSSASETEDALAVEEPLEIRLGYTENGRRAHKPVSITMRTPGNDFELATGFLFTENIVASLDEIEKIDYCGLPAAGGTLRNTVRVDLRRDAAIDFKRLERHFYTTSSCGVCGKSSIAALDTGAAHLTDLHAPQFDIATIHRLPDALRAAQNVFDRTGGLHAAALFDRTGALAVLREDVGRHNAVDKLIGSEFLRGNARLPDRLLFVSGRASFELVQKALMAKIPILAAVGAPSSLAVELAARYGMTLVGFVRDNRFNIYSHPARIICDALDATNLQKSYPLESETRTQ